MIREAEVCDVTRINELGKIINSNFEQLFNIEEMISDSYSRIYVYLKDDKIVGFISSTVLTDTADILDLVVGEDNRYMGVASNLLDYFISDLSDSIKLITLEVSTNNKAAINLYNKFGFEIVNVRKKYYSNGDDAYLMGRSIK